MLFPPSWPLVTSRFRPFSRLDGPLVDPTPHVSKRSHTKTLLRFDFHLSCLFFQPSTCDMWQFFNSKIESPSSSKPRFLTLLLRRKSITWSRRHTFPVLLTVDSFDLVRSLIHVRARTRHCSRPSCVVKDAMEDLLLVCLPVVSTFLFY